MPELFFNISGDCSGATSAIASTKAAITDLSGTRAEPTISVQGGDSAVSEIGRVGAAVGAASGTVRVGADTSGLSDAHSAVQDLRGGVQGLSRDVSELGGMNVGVGGGASISQLAGSLSGLSNSLTGASQSMGDFTRAGSAFSDGGEDFARAGSRMETSMGGISTSAQAATSDLRELASVGSQVQNMAAGGGSPSGSFGGGSGVSGDFGAWEREIGPPDTSPGGPDGPPRDPGDDGGRGRPPRPPGGSGGDGGGSGDGGSVDPFGAAEGVGGTAMMGAMVGGLATMATGAVGLMAVNEAIKATPDLAYAANGAMSQFDKGVRQTASDAISQGVPAIHALGSVMHGLGDEVGSVGAEHMGDALGAVSSLAGTATSSLQKLDPAIGPAIQGLTGLGNAVMQGFSSPEAVSGIKTAADTLANPSTQAAIADTVTGVVGAAGIITKATGDIAGNLDKATNDLLSPVFGDTGSTGSSAMTGGAVGGMLGKSVLGDLFGGGFAGGMKGLGVGGLLAAGGIGAASLEQAHGQESAITPTLAGEGIGSVLGGLVTGGSPAGISIGGAVGGATGYLANRADKAAGTNGFFQDVLGGAGTAGIAGLALSGGDPFIGGAAALIGGAAGGIKHEMNLRKTASREEPSGGDPDQPDTDSLGFSTDPGMQQAATAGGGWDRGSDGKLTPSSGANDPAGGKSFPNALPSTTPSQAQLFGGQGLRPDTGLPSDAMRHVGSSLGSSAATSGVSLLSSSMTSLGQNATTATSALSKSGQTATTAASQVSGVTSAVKPAVDSLSAVAPQVDSAMGQAASSVASGAEQMGSAVPSSFATGVKASTGTACDATSQMGSAATDCGKASLDSASPSKKFVELGEGIGQGLAIGVKSSTQGATSAVSAAMGSVVSAGAAALGAASPSKQFQAMGANLMSGAGNAVPSSAGFAGAPGLPGNQGGPQSGLLATPDDHSMPPQGVFAGRAGLVGTPPDATQAGQSATKAAQQTQDALKSNKQVDDDRAAAFQKSLQPLGYSPATNLRLGQNQKRDDDKQDQQRLMHDKDQQRALDTLNGTGQWGKSLDYDDPANKFAESPHDQRADQLRSDVANRQLDTRAAMNEGVPRAQATNEREQREQDASNPQSQAPGGNQGALAGRAGLLGQVQKQGQDLGQAMNKSMVVGMKASQGAVGQAGGDAAQGAIGGAKSKLDSDSPSLVFVQIGQDVMTGFSMGMAGGTAGASGVAGGAVGASLLSVTDVAQNYAADAGLVLGETYGTNVMSGINTTITENLLKATGLAQGVNSPLAKLALGQLGLLGVAGSGAESWNLTSTQPGLISFPGGTPANAATPTIPTPIVNVYIGNAALDASQQQVSTQNFQELAAALVGMRR